MVYFIYMMLVVAFIFIGRLHKETKDLKSNLKSLEVKIAELDKSTNQ